MQNRKNNKSWFHSQEIVSVSVKTVNYYFQVLFFSISDARHNRTKWPIQATFRRLEKSWNFGKEHLRRYSRHRIV